MNAWRGEYTDIEWLQMGSLLVGMPLAALLGSLFGFVGQWKRGRVVTAAMVGLGCAAVVSAVLFLSFLLLFTIFSDARGDVLLDYFNLTFGRQVTWMPLLCAGVISCLAAIGLRGKPRDVKASGVSLSMRQLLLLQVFTFATLGCWTGLRLTANSRLSNMERAKRAWGGDAWHIQPNAAGEPHGFFITTQAENPLFVKAIQEPWLKELTHWSVSDFGLFEMWRIKEAKQLESIDLRFAKSTKVDQYMVATVCEAPSLRSLSMWNIQIGKLDVANLSRLPQLSSVALGDSTIPAGVFREILGRATSLESLTLYDCEFLGEGSFDNLPPHLKAMHVRRLKSKANLSLERIGAIKELKTLLVYGGSLSRQEIEQIASLPKLEYLHLDCQVEANDLQLLGGLTTTKELWVLQKLAPQNRLEYRNAVQKLAAIPALEKLYVNFDSLLKPDEGDWDALTETPALVADLDQRSKEFGQAIQAIRDKQGLKKIQAGLGRSEMTPYVGRPGGSQGS